MRDCAFDELAARYDATFTDTRVGRALRGIVWSRLAEIFSPAQRILEIGCGTGEDAVWLASRGLRIVATDPSPRMIQLARQKARTGQCQERIEFRCASMDEIGSLAENELFDGVLSNFGAVNCVGDLRLLIANVATHLVPGAPLLWVVMGRHAPWEWLWYLSKGQWQKAWRRLRPAGVEWRGMTISYPTPTQMSSLLAPHFRLTRLAPLGFALPPSYAAEWVESSPLAARLLTRAERWAQRSRLLAGWADHYIVEAVRL